MNYPTTQSSLLERVWSSGTTKNLAMAGIVMPLAIVVIVLMWIFFITPTMK